MENISVTINDIVIQVDYKVELFGVLITLSDEYKSFLNIFQFDERNDYYVKKIKENFSFLKTTEILKEFNSLKNECKLHYQNPIELALSIDDNYVLKKNASNFFKQEKIINFLNKLKDFEKRINFKTFYLENKDLYMQWINSLETLLKKYNIKQKIVDYCGEKYNNLNFYLNLIPFETNGGYGFSIDNNAYYCLKAIKCDYTINNEIFLNSNSGIYLPITLHEYLHSIINPLTIKSNIFVDTKYLEKYYTQAYNSDYYVINENIVRAIVIRILCFLLNDYSLEELIQKEVEKGFEFVPVIIKSLIEYENNRQKYLNIDLFYEKIVQTVFKSINN